ncbi:hypothetical protein ACA910_007701 [Epithemia clementina (nom. ined.)]
MNGKDPSAYLSDVVAMSQQEAIAWARLPEDPEDLRKQVFGSNLDLKLEHVQQRAAHLKKAFGGDGQIVQSIIGRLPIILAKQDIELKVKYLTENVFEGDEAKCFACLQQNPVLLSFHHTKLRRRVDAMKKFGKDPKACMKFLTYRNDRRFRNWLLGNPDSWQPLRIPVALSTSTIPGAGLNGGQAHKQKLSTKTENRWRQAIKAVAGLTFSDDLGVQEGHLFPKLPPTLVDTLELLREAENQVMKEADLVAIDAEFRARELASTFQIAFRADPGPGLKTYVVDVMVADKDNEFRVCCRKFIERVFQQKLVLGFAPFNDLKGLDNTLGSALHCDLDCVLDLRDVWHRKNISLAALVTEFSSAGMELEKQRAFKDIWGFSPWVKRPLTPEQLEYAALDAAVLPVILSAMARTNKLTCAGGSTRTRRMAAQTIVAPIAIP